MLDRKETSRHNISCTTKFKSLSDMSLIKTEMCNKSCRFDSIFVKNAIFCLREDNSCDHLRARPASQPFPSLTPIFFVILPCLSHIASTLQDSQSQKPSVTAHKPAIPLSSSKRSSFSYPLHTFSTPKSLCSSFTVQLFLLWDQCL